MKAIDDGELQPLGYYSNDDQMRRKVKNIFEIGSLVFFWYFTAVITITTSKEIMNRVRLPFLLCSVQFLFAAGLSGLYLRYTGQHRSVPAHISTFLYQISFSYTIGFILTNWAFSIGKFDRYFIILF
jgi:hypothetical protein